MGGKIVEQANSAKSATAPVWGGLKNQITQLQDTNAT
jgi:hypothetical protein